MGKLTFLKGIKEIPFIVVNDGLVVELSKSFVEMTSFSIEDFLNKKITDVLRILRVGPGVNYDDIDDTTDYFFFTKSLEVKFVNIQVIEDIYFFSENPNSNFSVKIPLANALSKENYFGTAIYSIPDMTLLKANDKYVSFFDAGFDKRDKCIGRHISEFTTGFKDSSYEDIWINVIKTGKAYNNPEYKYEGLNRGITYWNLSINPIYLEGNLRYCVVIETEVTEQVFARKKVEEQADIIREQNKILKWQAGLINLSKDAIFAWELDGRILYWNKGAELKYGYTSEEAVGCVSHELLRTIHKENFKNVKESLINDELWNGEVEHTRKDGTKLIVESSHQIIVDEDGRKIILETNRDITMRKKMEIDLRNKKDELEEIIQSIDDAIFIYDGDKNYYITNNSAKKYYPDAVLNKFGDAYNSSKHYDLDGNELKLEDMPFQRIFQGDIITNDRVLIRNDKNYRYVSINGRPIYDKEGNFKFAVICCRDITKDIEDHKIIEQQKEELDMILDNMNDGFAIIDGNGNYVRVNKKVKQWSKIANIGPIGATLESTKYYDVNGREITYEDLPATRILKGEIINQYQMLMKGNGINKYFSVSGIPIYDEQGNFSMGVINTRDITEMINQSKMIMEQKEQLEAIIDNISEELYIIDKERNYLMLNSIAKDRYNTFKFNNSEEYTNKNKLYDLEGNEIDFNSTPIARLAKGEYIKNETIIVSDPYKRYISINAKPIFDSKGQFGIGVMLTRDITERVLQEQKIKHQNDQLNAIIDSMQDGLGLVNNKMQIKFLNQSARGFFYETSDEIKVRNTLNCCKYYYGIDGDEIPLEDLPAYRVLSKGSFQNYILTIDRPDKKIYASINGSTINDGADTLNEGILSIRDITEQVMKDKIINQQHQAVLQAEIEKSKTLQQAIEMKDEFLSLISHEFRTPLNVINAAVQALNLLCGDELSERSKRYINTIRQNTFRQLRLVNNLLDITRADAGRIKIHKRNLDIVFLTKSIVESVKSYASQKGVTVAFSSSVEKKIIGMDDEKYERIFLNLLSNAIKFTPEGKKIQIKLRTIKNNIRIDVKDNGIGIPQDKVDVIFERFGQVDSCLSRQAEGSGIGLSLVKKLVDVLDGSISVKSKVGKGSTFTVLFPIEKVEEEHNEISMGDLLDNRLVQVTTVEFSDIYL
ncbi:PAS domain S-box protein [Clostridium sp. YIM B02505]|uniref:histidine kinase n=1 Tax=Clostridium yunnanense TaxID=2800325 RepID=A0ABS1ERX5_9CLOT|nr:PAS domain S-box protein [Clostridium yunnanense]MBK1812102.1 PAS domain S-box protein [Clostridium yunnanense]